MWSGVVGEWGHQLCRRARLPLHVTRTRCTHHGGDVCVAVGDSAVLYCIASSVFLTPWLHRLDSVGHSQPTASNVLPAQPSVLLASCGDTSVIWLRGSHWRAALHALLPTAAAGPALRLPPGGFPGQTREPQPLRAANGALMHPQRAEQEAHGAEPIPAAVADLHPRWAGGRQR